MSKSVLIVDDEPNIVLSLEYLMKKAGYVVHTASDGEEALIAVSQQLPNLILLDVMMPKLNGYEVCQKIRANQAYAGIKIIMITAKGRTVEREKGLAMGVDEYMTKPFSIQELMDKVAAMLNGIDK